MHRFYPECIFCGKVVLRIAGQDFYLGPEFAENWDIELPTGYCHLKCMQVSSDLDRFYERTRQLYQNTWELAYTDDYLSILTHIPAYSCMILKREGWFISLNFRTTITKSADGVAIDTSQAYTLFRGWNPSVYDSITDTFAKGNQYPFSEYIRAFEAESSLLTEHPLSYRMQANRIIITNIEGEDYKKPLDEDTLELRVDFSLQIPETIWKNVPDKCKKQLQLRDSQG